VKVLDFGIARQVIAPSPNSPTLTRQTVFGCTVRYASPELLREESVTPSSDMFSLGIVLYELVAGQHPFEAASAAETAYNISLLLLHHRCVLQDPMP
jgi:eukaryotic-like serine/threonine-protein kinase